MAFNWKQYLEMNPSSLGWGDFRAVPNAIHGEYDAEAGFRSRTKGGFSTVKEGSLYRMVLEGEFRVVVIPDAIVWKDAKQTHALLDHEDVHYQFAYVLARAMLNEMDALRKQKKSEFSNVLHDMSKVHMVNRVDALHKKYDKETEHGKNTEPQRRWQKALNECVADDTATTLMGLPL